MRGDGIGLRHREPQLASQPARFGLRISAGAGGANGEMKARAASQLGGGAIVPPISSVSWRGIASPNPVPPLARVMEPSIGREP